MNFQARPRLHSESGARPPRALPTAPSPLAFRREAPNRMVSRPGAEFGAGARRTAAEAAALTIPLIPCFRLRERGFWLRPGRAACLTPFKNFAVCATRSAGVCICLAPFGRSAGFQTCRIADFQSAEPSPVPRLWRRRSVCGLETRDTAGLETCATARSPR